MKKRRFLSVLTAAAMLTAMIPRQLSAAPVAVHAVDAETIRIMPVGDSLTNGYNNPGGYRKYLDYFLKEKEISFDLVGPNTDLSNTFNYNGLSYQYDSDHAGFDGFQIKEVPAWGESQNTGSLYNELSANSTIQEYEPDIILLTIGTNDMTADADPKNCSDDLKALLDLMLENIKQDSMIFLASLPECRAYGCTAERVDEINRMIKEVADEYDQSGKNVSFADVHGCLTLEDIGSDNIHPTAEGYEKIGKFWANTVNSYLYPSSEIPTQETTEGTTTTTAPEETTSETTTTAPNPLTDLPEGFSFDAATGTLTISGKLDRLVMKKYVQTNAVLHIIAAEGTIIPANSVGLFSYAAAETIDLSKADFSNVYELGMFFASCLNLKSVNLSGIDTSKVTSMAGMFMLSDLLTELDLTSFEISNLEQADSMFYHCYGLQTIKVSENWNLAEDCTSKDMFKGDEKLVGGNGTVFDEEHIDIEYARIDTPDTPGYFTYQANPELVSTTTYETSGIVTTTATTTQPDPLADLPEGFSFDAATGTLTISGFIPTISDEPNISKLISNSSVKHIIAAEGTVMPAFSSGIFTAANAETIDLSKADFSNATELSLLFSYCKNLKSVNLCGIDTSNVKATTGMFMSCTSLTEIDLSSFKTDNLQKTDFMFHGCNELQTIKVSDNWHWDEVISSGDMFYNTVKLVGGNGTVYDEEHIDIEYARIDTPDTPGYFTYQAKPEPVSTTTYETSGIGTTTTTSTTYETSGIGTTTTTTTTYETSGIGSTTTTSTTYETSDIGTTTTTIVTTTTAPPDQPVSDGMAVLDNETGVLSISGHIELSLLTPFQENPAVKSIVAEEGTVLPQDCSWLFCHFDEVTSIDLSHADTSNVKFMTGLFSEMVKLTSINLSGFDTSNVKVMREMFNACENLTELDLSTFDTSNVEDMMRMFSLNNKLKTVYVSDSWTMDKVENHELMFTFNFAITGGNGTVYDAEHTDGEYARIDSADAPGYFTRKETEPPTAEFDAETGILTLKGNVKAKDVKAYANNENVTGIVCAEGTVLPDNCSALLKDFNQVQSIDFSNADSSGVTNMSYMFENCEALTELDLSSFDTSKVKNTESMFSGDTLLKTVTVSDRWTMENVDVSTNMFGDNTALTGENGTAFTTDHTNYAYARIDTPKTPGYFTAKEEPAAVMTGDVNNDGSISSIDALLIYRYLNGWENVDLDTNAVDINGDDDFTISDAVIITRYINGWEGYDAYFSG